MTSDQVRDALDPDICDEHGGWLRRLCPVCRNRDTPNSMGDSAPRRAGEPE